jgi:HAD superfamily hydrolase (TIGR01549 family)
MIKAVIFDLDDTLVKTSEAKYDALKHAAKKFYNLKLSTEQIRSHWGKPFPAFMNDLFGTVDSIESIIHNYRSIRNGFPSLAYEGAVQTIKNLSSQYIVCLLTAGTKAMVEEDLLLGGFDLKLFHYIQTAEHTEVHKPDPAVFKPALTFLNAKNILQSEVIYVGDSPHDCAAAKGSGLHFVALIDRTHTKDEFSKEAFTISHLSDLPQLLKSIQ